MDRGSKVIELHKNRGEDPVLAASAPQIDPGNPFTDFAPDFDQGEGGSTGKWRRPLALALCAGGSALWLALLGWQRWSALGTRAPGLDDLVSFIMSAAPPLAMLGVLWLVLMRSSRAEADRFTRTRIELETESQRLEALLAFVSTRIESARQALAVQGDTLLQLGEDTATRITASSQSIGNEIGQITTHANALMGTAAAARGDLAVLMAQLPKAQVQMRNIATAMQEAGQSAVGGAKALSGEVLALGLKAQEARGLAKDAVGALAEQFNALTSTSDALHNVLAESRELLLDTADSGAEALGERVAAINTQIDRMGTTLAAQDQAGQALVARMGEGIDGIDGQFAALEQATTGRTERLSLALGALRNHADDLKAALEGGSGAASQLSEKTESLLTALDAAAREVEERLPASYGKLEGHAASAMRQAESVQPVVTALAASSEVLAQHVGVADAALSQQQIAFDAMVKAADAQLSACQTQVEGLIASLAGVSEEANAISRSAGTDLLDVLTRTRDVAQQATTHTREALAGLVPEAADAMADKSRAALSTALSAEIETQMAAMADAVERSVGAALTSVAALEEQVRGISRTSSAITARIESAQDESDKRDHVHFARRVALLIESLNSTAIDVTKILSNDVTDSAWASYMRGDRGIFARRAVKLLDNSEAREIARHYQDDPEFREQVNRYIHDFEAMLRNVMATRDGTPLSVALLSSDTGKLYVALAQAIERLRA
jgi:hypothetical protein